MSTTLGNAWPTQLHLPGQAAAPARWLATRRRFAIREARAFLYA